MIHNNEWGVVGRTGAERVAFPNLPLSYEEMLLFVPDGIRKQNDKRHRPVYGLIQSMARQLEDARSVSTIPPKRYLTEYREDEEKGKTQFRIDGIRQEMAAIRFRMEIADYCGTAERKNMESRMLDLYELAKRFDPRGIEQFERLIDKRMRKARI